MSRYYFVLSGVDRLVQALTLTDGTTFMKTKFAMRVKNVSMSLDEPWK